MMSTKQSIDEADIRQQIDALTAAVRDMDLESAMLRYAPDIVSYDIVAPLRHVSADAKRHNWIDVFAVCERPLGYEVRDLAITVADDVAFGHSLNHVTATFKNGTRTDVWVRWTACFRKIHGRWLIAHDHVSVPADVASGRALVDLRP